MRSASDAQWEARQLSNALKEEFNEWMPITAQIYEEELEGRMNRLAP